VHAGGGNSKHKNSLENTVCHTSFNTQMHFPYNCLGVSEAFPDVSLASDATATESELSALYQSIMESLEDAGRRIAGIYIHESVVVKTLKTAFSFNK